MQNKTVFDHPIYSELDDIRDKEVTRELHCTLVIEGKEPEYYEPFGGNKTDMESTNSFSNIIRDYRRIAEIMNRYPGMYRDGVVKVTYDGITYDLRKESDTHKLREKAIHFVGLPDL
jgi:hypothetical protein